ncbi:hypothetical protein F441_21777 [Phytophthora nicotianae CJ01A1]|uniref:Uncharacterized protein n=4 Tax=Phytophthora nicotianae TaxID=4792 RepID=W2VRM7_PHYNI|nr:hypothetical protein L915_21288 [Phytophthora nicotianae]ETO59793.1 hypothetical protein F444_21916 [Phytophthora nicotianae P1976]ETP00871.1 hypothetical protein F441_21777 [Phytophthora nicotianae CJ01A1]
MTRRKAKRSANVLDKCFRLLRLKHEVQNDARVMKTVVDEVDVLRLCHSLGMAVSDEGNRALMHKFELGMFSPSKYDTDFARFVREKLDIGGGSSAEEQEQLEIGSLFGKQAKVKTELVRMGFWSCECENNLSLQDQGVYCIERDGEHGDRRQFIAASLFEAEVIRETLAYVLRFLISLSSNITCCLSQQDYQRIENEVHAACDVTTTQWNSCSVAFRVQRQDEQSDSVRCSKPTKTLITRSDPIKSVEFIGGAFPAIAVESAKASTTEWVTDNSYMSSTEFADWVLDKHQRYALELPRKELPESIRVSLLNKFDHFPDLQDLGRRSDEQLEKLSTGLLETFPR